MCRKTGFKPNIRPVDKAKRLRDLRPGDDAIIFDKEPVKVLGVQIYR